MIKIKTTKKQRYECEQAYWNWFKKNQLANVKRILGTSLELRDHIGISIITDEEIKKWIFARPNKLQEIKRRIDLGTEVSAATKDKLLKIFELFRKSVASPTIVNKLGIQSCPYCNMGMLGIGPNKKKELKFWGQFDHFYDKQKYPDLAFCLYNLIPACGVCNLYKSDTTPSFQNPYNNKYKSDIKFGTDFDDKYDIYYLLGASDNFKITISGDENEREIFCIDGRYSLLKRNAKDIIFRANAYNNLVLDNYFTEYKFDTILRHESFFDYSDKDDLQINLSKFNRDIMEEFLVGSK